MPRPIPPPEPPTRPRQPDPQGGTLDPDERIDLEGDQSFPASDPPSWTLGPEQDG